MDAAGLEKLDTALLEELRAFEASADAPADDGISVNLRFEGDLAPIEALGFEPMSVFNDQALGVVRFRDIPAVAAHPNVLSLSAGQTPRKHVDQAVPDIRVRASSSANVGTDGLWHITKTGADPKFDAGATGEGVIIGIIDTGIDYLHPMFVNPSAPEQTRILRIWDQGLKPADVSQCPDGALLSGGATKRYGVEYMTPAINEALTGNPTKMLDHRDCDGHGTHVAGIAAGGVFFPKDGDASRVGVAPKADLIVVKMLDLPDEVRYKKTGAGFGDKVMPVAMFRDAVLYCLRVARRVDPANKKPIVLNMSFGDISMPGDGLDDDARWLDELLDPTKPEGDNHFPSGCIIVKSMGNDGDDSERRTAKITVPVGGKIIVPLKLIDPRVGVNDTWKDCDKRKHSPSIDVHFWYRPRPGTIKFALRFPGLPGFNPEIAVGATFDKSFTMTPAPPSIAFSAPSTTHHRVVLSSKVETVTHPDPPNPTVTRHHVVLRIHPKDSGGAFLYQTGTYEIRITAAAGTEIFAMCGEEWWGKLSARFVIPDKMMDDVTPTPADIKITSESSAADPYGRNVITVAAYDNTITPGGDPTKHPIADLSSRGPLRDFSNPARGPIAVKPDIAAPGIHISSADSKHVEKRKFTAKWLRGVRFANHDGTSMAAPFIAGVVALLLDKKPAMKTSDVRTALNTGAALRPGGDPAPVPEHAAAFGSGMVDGLKSHKSI